MEKFLNSFSNLIEKSLSEYVVYKDLLSLVKFNVLTNLARVNPYIFNNKAGENKSIKKIDIFIPNILAKSFISQKIE